MLEKNSSGIDDMSPTKPCLNKVQSISEMLQKQSTSAEGAFGPKEVETMYVDLESIENIQESEPQPTWKPFIGYILMMIGVGFFAVSTVLCKFVYMQNTNLNGIDYMLVRSTTLVFVSLSQAWYLGVNILDVKKEGRKWLFIRCLLGAIGMPSFYIGLKFLPASKAQLISTLHPLLVTVVGYYFLKEKLGRYDIIAVIGAFSGVVVMNVHKTNSSYIDTSDGLLWVGIFLCSLTTMFGVGVTISIRLMNQHIHYMLNSSYFAYTLFLLSMMLLLFAPDFYHFSHYRWQDVLLFALSGVFHYTAQTFTSMSYKYEEASKVSPLSYTIGICLLFFDMLMFGYQFSFSDISGVIMVICALLTPILYKLWHLKKDQGS